MWPNLYLFCSVVPWMPCRLVLAPSRPMQLVWRGSPSLVTVPSLPPAPATIPVVFGMQSIPLKQLLLLLSLTHCKPDSLLEERIDWNYQKVHSLLIITTRIHVNRPRCPWWDGISILFPPPFLFLSFTFQSPSISVFWYYRGLPLILYIFYAIFLPLHVVITQFFSLLTKRGIRIITALIK